MEAIAHTFVDPNMVHLDWGRTTDALALVVVLAFIVERALAVVFENALWVERNIRSGVKELIAVVVAVTVCWHWGVDLVSMLILTEKTSAEGYILTGLVVAGGSKASIKLFHDVLNIQSAASKARHENVSRHTLRKLEDAVESDETSSTSNGAHEARALAETADKQIALVKDAAVRQELRSQLDGLARRLKGPPS